MPLLDPVPPENIEDRLEFLSFSLDNAVKLAPVSWATSLRGLALRLSLVDLDEAASR